MSLDVSSIYPSDSRHVAPPKSMEDAQVTCGMHDLGGPTYIDLDWDLATCYQGYAILGE